MANLNPFEEDDDELLGRIELFVVNDLLASSHMRNLFPELVRDENETRNKNYNEETISNYTLGEFRDHFRMSRSSFSLFKDLMEKVGNYKRISGLERKLLFTLWTVSKQESFLSVGDRFNLANSSGYAAFCGVLDVLCGLVTEYIKWPSASDYHGISQAFREKSGGYIPGIIGAIDGCHIQTKQPLHNPIDYYNRKNTHSVILQAVCDHRTIFTDIYVGAPGRLHDARMYQNSPLSGEINRLVSADYHLVGDTAYPLSHNLVTPFRNNGHLIENQINFNIRLSCARVTIERAFGFLKGRFRRLKYLDVAEPSTANKIVTACCVLHNHIQIRSNEDFENNDIEFDYEDSTDPPTANATGQQNTERGSQARKRNYLLSLF